jgi:hypothetical protein
MKRIPFYTAIALMVLLTAALVIWHRSHNAMNSGAANMVSTNLSQMPTDSVKLKPTNGVTDKHSEPAKQPIDPMKEAGITPDMTQTQREQKYAEWVVKEAARFVPEQKPFAFYGKVIDENTQAVAGASIHFGLRTTSSPDGTSNAETASAEDGSFSLVKGTGSHLHVDVWKDGYYTAGSHNSVEFDDTTGGGSSKENPALFFLKKKGKGADLISAVLDAKIPRDGTPMKIDLINRQMGADGQLQLSQVKPPYESWKKATEWSFKMEIPAGGFVEQNDEFPFEAPANGYQSTITFDFKADQPDWKTSFKKSYYIVFGTPLRYGRIDIESDIMWGGAHISYAVNPDGSRYLEPKN